MFKKNCLFLCNRVQIKTVEGVIVQYEFHCATALWYASLPLVVMFFLMHTPESLSCILPYVAIPRHVLSKARKESSDINIEQWLSRGKARKESETNNTIMQHGTWYGFGREQSGLKLSQTKCYWTKYICNCPPSCSTIKVQFSPKTLLQNPTVPLADYLNASLHIALSKTNRPIFYLFKMLLTNVLSVHTTFYCP